MVAIADLDTRKSEALAERASRVLAGGGKAAMRPHSLRFSRAEGCHITDLDGNTFLDYVSGWSTLALGHAPKLVMERVEAQLRSGVHFSSSCEAEVEFAERIVRLLPSVDSVK